MSGTRMREENKNEVQIQGTKNTLGYFSKDNGK
jgi:hypothetical protein